ncbi:hypothetical protein AGR5A_pa40085 [Agrobacterium genomosp. 5 str. CFBP 6626]|nr:hypothetical protein AGR5A_pa40085 [Agrobacterium genomosp. 5 str. CFBP 6626]
MDRNPGIRASDRRVARSHHPPRQHPRDERRQLSSRPEPRPKGRLTPLKKSPPPPETPARATPSRRSQAAAIVADFCSAPWPVFTPPLTGSMIDHIAVSGALRLASWRVGPDFGSNHIPVVADLSFN